jgi:hypothetical protein
VGQAFVREGEQAMDDFPFSTDEWSRVKDAARAVLNATLAGDAALRASHFQELRLVLAGLRATHGDHPALLETEADFSDEPVEQRRLYQAAIEQAQRADQVTYSVRIALARLLLDDFDEPGRAREELMSCEPELAAHADETERREWDELLARCKR